MRPCLTRTASRASRAGGASLVGLVGLAGLAAGWLLLGPLTQAAAASAFSPPLPPPLTVLAAFDPPAKPWQPGNRGVDLAASTGEPVLAAASGIVIYAGQLAGRGVVSISHGGLRTTYEPVAPIVRAGDQVARAQVIGHVSGEADACGPPGSCLHWGAREGDVYVDPMRLLGSRPSVRLLPVWGDALPNFSAPGPPTEPDHRPASPTAPLGPVVAGRAAASPSGDALAAASPSRDALAAASPSGDALAGARRYGEPVGGGQGAAIRLASAVTITAAGAVIGAVASRARGHPRAARTPPRPPPRSRP